MAELPLRDALVGARPYGAPVDPAAISLNVNENPYPPPPAVVAAMADAAATAAAAVNRYPDREAITLRQSLAQYVSSTTDVALDAAAIWPANGSNEVFSQILGAFGGPGCTLLSFTPTYSMYPVYARDTSTTYATAPRADDGSLDLASVRRVVAEHRPSVVVVASPNNPTGTVLALDQIRALHDLVAADAVVVIDEAYAEFAVGNPSAITLLADCPRLVVTRTLSKAWGLAGLRLGYAVTSPAIVDALRIVRLPYHLSAITQAVAVAALGHHELLLAPVAEVVAERQRLSRWLAEHDIAFLPSHGNFVCIGPLPDASSVFAALRDHGILVRETGGPGRLRISIGTPTDNDALRHGLLAALANEPKEQQQ